MRGVTGPLWAADYVNGTWQEARTVPRAEPQTAPAAAYLNNQPYVMYLR
ncbi:hypothetical protein OG594_24385 [Streptomyces sp. NBC_01214]|nr:hypothetical protein [Streptomyces sp. NBC_01214]MCX4804715.1 hypothetical protein [Streptomyces sp. NBC_01214]